AKTAMLKTREYAAEESRRVVLAFDRYGRKGDEENFEGLVSYAASLAYHLINDGIEVAFISDDWKSGQGNSPLILDSILQYLAVVEMSSSPDPLPAIGNDTFSLSLKNSCSGISRFRATR